MNKSNIKKIYHIIPLALLAVAITFSTELNVAQIENGRMIVVRAEDILLILFGLVWFLNFFIIKKFIIKKSPLFKPILIWVGFCSFSVIINWLMCNITLLRGFFYFLKEIEFFFLYFIIFNKIKDNHALKKIIDAWLIIGFCAMLLIIYQFTKGIHYGAYGPGLFKEIGPLPSGGFFLILFIYYINIFIYYYSQLKISKIKKFIIFTIIILFSIGIISSGSKASIIGAICGILLSLFIYLEKSKKKIRPILIGITIITIGVTFFFVILKDVGYLRGLTNPNQIYHSASVRKNIWTEQINDFSKKPEYFLTGMGKSIRLDHEESHNQYVRTLIETGAIGFLIFIFLIYSIIKITKKRIKKKQNPLTMGLSAGTFCSTIALLVVGVTAEVFLVVRVMMIYWFFVALTMFAINDQKNVNKYENITK